MTGINFAEMKREIAHKKCLRHPKNRAEVGIEDGQYVPLCVACKREGTMPIWGEGSHTLERS